MPQIHLRVIDATISQLEADVLHIKILGSSEQYKQKGTKANNKLNWDQDFEITYAHSSDIIELSIAGDNADDYLAKCDIAIAQYVNTPPITESRPLSDQHGAMVGQLQLSTARDHSASQSHPSPHANSSISSPQDDIVEGGYKPQPVPADLKLNYDPSSHHGANQQSHHQHGSNHADHSHDHRPM